METIKFSSLNDLYNRLLPALIIKTDELKRQGGYFIKAEDIWNYLKLNKWLSASDLTLAEMVSDIFNTDFFVMQEYLKNVLNNQNRDIIPDYQDDLL